MHVKIPSVEKTNFFMFLLPVSVTVLVGWRATAPLSTSTVIATAFIAGE